MKTIHNFNALNVIKIHIYKMDSVYKLVIQIINLIETIDYVSSVLIEYQIVMNVFTKILLYNVIHVKIVFYKITNV